MIKVELTKNNNLQISLDVPPFIFKRFLRKNDGLNFNQLWEKLLEKTELVLIEPNKVGALTDAPIIKWNQNYYWLSDYQVINEFDILLHNKKIIFEKTGE